jgi:hypothetical protein
MFNRGEWRVRHIDYENAPDGRAVHSPSPYRWWLGLVAWADQAGSSRSAAQSVERAALVGDPLLHFLLVLGIAGLVWWRFGALAAALVSVGCVTVFPFAAGFLPGAPDDHGLAQIFALGSVLLLAAGVGIVPPTDDGKSTRRWFVCAGITGGLGLWLSVALQGPVLIGLAAGALFAAWISGRVQPAARILPWRAWAMAGGITTFLACLIEFFPAHLGDWELSFVHPLYAVAWLGGGLVLAQAVESIQGKKIPRTVRGRALLAAGIAAFVALPVPLWKIQGAAFLIPDSASLRLTRLPEGVVAQNLAAWISHDGATPTVLATLLPLVLLAPATWLLWRARQAGGRSVAVALVLGPVLVAFGFACQQLAWWSLLDGLLLVLLVALTAETPGAASRPYVRLALVSAAVLLLLPGALRVAPREKTETESDLTRSEVLGLIERDLAGWLALHGDHSGVVVLAPPNEATALCYYGGLRGIGSLSWENKEGVLAAIRILSAPSVQEAKELVDRRGITHIVLLSWDSYFDDYARAATGKIEGSFRDQLKLSTLPLWLRPLAYPLPAIAGFEGQSITVLEVVEEQDPATTLSWIATYFVETGNLDEAAAAAQGLKRFPADFGAWVARAEVEQARGDEAEFARTLKVLQARLGVKTAPALAWDQRVGLAVVLAKAKQEALARTQLTLCVAQADEKKLRMLNPGSLYRLLVLSRAFGVNLDPQLRERALELVPAELRERLK